MAPHLKLKVVCLFHPKYLGFKLFENTITHLLRYKVFINCFHLVLIWLCKLYIFYCPALENLNRNSEFHSQCIFPKICERNKLNFWDIKFQLNCFLTGLLSSRPGLKITRFSSPTQIFFKLTFRTSFIVSSVQILLENDLLFLRYDFFTEIRHTRGIGHLFQISWKT